VLSHGAEVRFLARSRIFDAEWGEDDLLISSRRQGEGARDGLGSGPGTMERFLRMGNVVGLETAQERLRRCEDRDRGARWPGRVRADRERNGRRASQGFSLDMKGMTIILLHFVFTARCQKNIENSCS